MKYTPTLRWFGKPAVAAITLAVLAGCAPTAPGRAPEPSALPPIPSVDGALAIEVVHPTPRTPFPDVDSAYIYGSVGTGDARLSINGTSVNVAPNGAFLAYIPLPESGTYILEAGANGQIDVQTVSYRMPVEDTVAEEEPIADPDTASAIDSDSVAPTDPPEYIAQSGTITAGADTLVTGSDVAIGRPTPSGTYKWFLPEGARLTVVGEAGEQVEVRLDSTTTAWFPAETITLAGPPAAGPVVLGVPTFEPADEWVDVRIPANGAPFLVEVRGDTVAVILYGTSAGTSTTISNPDPLISAARLDEAGSGSTVLLLELARSPWGYKAFYTEYGDLVFRLRRPPQLDPNNVLSGLRIAVDAGHPPGGATGPTGLAEAEANLAISLRLAEQLRARGAEVLLTRPDAEPVGLEERVNAATAWNADLLVSVHNNAFAEGVNPFTNSGTSVYYFHPFAADLARSLDREIVEVTGIADLGAKWSNLALARPTWMPSVLTESLFMLIPRQEAALKNPTFLDRLAAAHLRGIENALRNYDP